MRRGLFTSQVHAKCLPQVFGALRWNQQFFNHFPDGTGGSVPWTDNVWRLDAALTWYLTAHLQAKLQYSFLCTDYTSGEYQNDLAAQFTLRF